MTHLTATANVIQTDITDHFPVTIRIISTQKNKTNDLTRI